MSQVGFHSHNEKDDGEKTQCYGKLREAEEERAIGFFGGAHSLSLSSVLSL